MSDCESEQQQETIDIPQCGRMEIDNLVGIQWSLTASVKLCEVSFTVGDYVPDFGVIAAICKNGAKEHMDKAETKGSYMVETKVLSNEQFALLAPRTKEQLLTLLRNQLNGVTKYRSIGMEELGDIEREKVKKMK
ncbi:hypothetical protein HK097_005300, partial [Rhizophlyctis rosea]